MEMKPLAFSECVLLTKDRSTEEDCRAWLEAIRSMDRKIVVLDDDPTGVQTVHGVPVFTDWAPRSLKRAFREDSRAFYILTNSRAMSEERASSVNREIGRALREVGAETGEKFVVVSRGDSTLRGHFPAETEALAEGLGGGFDGEILIPCFFEAGRYTYRDVHLVREGNLLVPAGETEFAKDPTFGYEASDLGEWIEEKTGGRFPAREVSRIPLALLREGRIGEIRSILNGVSRFGKVLVNAFHYGDLRVFVRALESVMAEGKSFLFRSAASLVPALAGIEKRPLLTSRELTEGGGKVSGLVVVGSFVEKTTRQLESLRSLEEMDFIEWHVEAAMGDAAATGETASVLRRVEESFAKGRDACVFTTRKYRWTTGEKSEKNLEFSTRVSGGLVNVVRGLKTRPGFIVAKGGITSSDIGVHGLGVKRALVLGQILPGIPVWKLGEESRFPGGKYVIFPGNVGQDDSLKTAVLRLKGLA